MTVVQALPPVEDRILRRPAARWTGTPDELKELRQALGITITQFDAVGCAAPQIARPFQVALIVAHGLELLVLNPRLYAEGAVRETEIEGCLSLPGRIFQVRRYRCVRLETVDERGAPLVVIARDELARVIQHEVDHLRGVLIDRSGEELAR